MKSVKLSLATIVAAGALTSVASATPLEQAIKDVDISGMAFLRYETSTSRNDANGVARVDGQTVDGKTSNGFWKFKTQINLKFALDDNFYALLGVRYENRDHSYGNNNRAGVVAYNKGAHTNNNRDGYHDDTLDINQYALGYHIGNTDVLLGRQILGSFLTADMSGTGLKVVNKDIQGLTLTAGWFDALEDDTDISSSGLGRIVDFNRGTGRGNAGNGKYAYQHNLGLIQINGSYNPVDFALWYADLASVAALYGVNVAAFFDINDNFGLGAHAQFAGSNLHGALKDGVDNALEAGWRQDDGYLDYRELRNRGISDAASANYWAAKADMKLFGLDASAGYLQYGKKDAISLVSLEDNGKLIKPGEKLIDTTAFTGKHSYWFVTAKYTFLEKYWVGADFVHGKTKYDEGDIKQWESVVRLGYKHNKKLDFFGWWSHKDQKDDAVMGRDEVKSKDDVFRFQATYKF